MSSILKALKKVEDEKASRSDAPVDIARDILRQGGRPRSSNGLFVSLVVAGIVLVAGVFAYLVSGERKQGVEPTLSPAPVSSTGTPVPVVVNLPLQDSSGEKAVTEVGVAPEVSRPFEGTALPSEASAPESQAPGNLPGLVVTGIAYQEERGGRLAIVNELPVMEGTLIEGARIEEILEDRVRFSKDGRTFDVELGNP